MRLHQLGIKDDRTPQQKEDDKRLAECFERALEKNEANLEVNYDNTYGWNSYLNIEPFAQTQGFDRAHETVKLYKQVRKIVLDTIEEYQKISQ